LEVTTLKQKAVVFNSKDNVATALDDLKAGDTLALKAGEKNLSIKLTAPVPFGHKFSLENIASGSPVIKYGEAIGIATAAIQVGDYVHVHNVASARARGDLAGGAK
jgi:altronate dehydratase small subunit